MFSGLERERAALRRQRSVAWAWIKARGVLESRPTPAFAKQTTSPLLTRVCAEDENATNWRESLAAITYRTLARQLCDRFYDLSIFQAWHNRNPQGLAAGRMITPALPSYCRDDAVRAPDAASAQMPKKSRILEAVLPAKPEPRSGVLVYLRSKAA